MQKLSGTGGFEAYYQPIIQKHCGEQNYHTLLSKTNNPVLVFLRDRATEIKELWHSVNLHWEPVTWYPYAVKWPTNVGLGTILPGYAEKLIYPMNASSLLPVVTLDPRPGDLILDACAAPGGKSIALSNLITPNSIIANDISPTRNHTMRNLFFDYHLSISSWHRKAETIYQTQSETFDKILLDAPCSSEKHVYQNPKELAKWSTNRIKQLRTRQIALISGLILALKPGGTLVYSTCAITPEENEGVVAEIVKRKGDIVKLLPWKNASLPGRAGIPGDYIDNFDLNSVRRIFPSNESSFDPMFVAVFQHQ